ncbi:uncharacterized protein LOC131322503 [Rhododendron vialii]|uniref:uncharacterized protein LOC131322503 n=1 Tax=Rhododendron vialii TaxID=182163 RepID=UPI00265DB96E|nr:uncharacterized protein LOC131322503 [Rhododendron vialii]
MTGTTGKKISPTPYHLRLPTVTIDSQLSLSTTPNHLLSHQHLQSTVLFLEWDLHSPEVYYNRSFRRGPSNAFNILYESDSDLEWSGKKICPPSVCLYYSINCHSVTFCLLPGKHGKCGK